MKIVLTFDSFKGCLTAEEACHTAAVAIKELMPEADTIECPLSDGGEGLVACVAKLLPTKRIAVQVHDPLMHLIDASYLISADGQTAYMEMAAASGLTLVPEEQRNPLKTTTYGVGEMILDAARRGCQEIVMGIGGSATCDGGRGMIECLAGTTRLPHITVASDVTNPLYGKEGAAYVFGPQKGATPEQVIQLDEQLRAFAHETEVLGLATPNLAHHPGAGAAGGLGYALMAYLKADLRSGIDIMLDINEFDHIIKDADLVITGEGKSDEQTLMGKVPFGVLRRCRQLTGTFPSTIPVWLLSGSIDDKDGRLATHFSRVLSINEGDSRPLDILMRPEVAKQNLFKTIKQEIIKTQ